jgi:cellulose 1,4-beta-cellobiosidase
MDKSKCKGAASAYRTLTVHAIKELDLPNVAMYLDAGHAGWLGWEANIKPAAQVFSDIYNQAGKPGAVRGLATNVANYNSWDKKPCPSYTRENKNACNEKDYVEKLGPMLREKGFPAHFIMDTCKHPHPRPRSILSLLLRCSLINNVPST